MKPYIICHMMTSVDGRIDCAMVDQLDPTDAYYETLDRLECPSQLMGRVTMQMHYADSQPFVPSCNEAIGHEDVFVGTPSVGYTIAIDTYGRLSWPGYCYDGKPLLVITSERCSKIYLETLTRRGIAWIAVGADRIDLPRAMEILNHDFGVQRLALLGGGHINGAFLEARLIDEVSLMLSGGIDGRKGMPAVFDGIDDANRNPVLLTIQSVEQLNQHSVWIRYKIENE